MNTSTILSAILGSFLGFLATLVSSQITTKRDDNARKRAHSQYMRLELEGAMKSFDEIRTSYEHKNNYDYSLLDLLDNYVNNLQDARKQAYLIRDEKLQGEIFSLINRISLLSKDMRGVQNYEYAENEMTDAESGKKRSMNSDELAGKQSLIRDKRQSNLMEILDLKREVKSVAEKLNTITS